MLLTFALATSPADAALYGRRLLEYTGNNCVNALGNTLCGQLSGKCGNAPLLRFVCTQACHACRRPTTAPGLLLDASRANPSDDWHCVLSHCSFACWLRLAQNHDRFTRRHDLLVTHDTAPRPTTVRSHQRAPTG